MAVRYDNGAGSPTTINGFSRLDWGAGSPSSLASFDAPEGEDTGSGSPSPFLAIVAAPLDLTTVLVIFNDTIDTSASEILASWSISPVGLGAEVAIIAVDVDGEDVTLTLSGPLTPGIVYELAGSATSGVFVWSNGVVEFIAPLAFAEPERPDIGLLRGLLSAFGKQLNRVKGTTRTTLAQDYVPGSGLPIVVVTTLNTPSAGAVYAGQYRFTYVGRSDTAFLAAEPDMQDMQETLIAGTPVVLDDRYWLPSDLLALPNVRDFLDPWYVQEATNEALG